MGIRISLYAVDEPLLEALLDRSIGETLCHYAAEGTDPARGMFAFSDRPAGPIYHAIPGRGIHCGDRWYPPEELPLARHPLLAQPVRHYLATNAALSLKLLLSCLSRCAGVQGIRRITEDHRRWWVGSFFHTAAVACGVSAPKRPEEWARRNWDLSPADHHEAVRLFGNLLRDYNVEPPLSRTPYTLADVRFPVVPAEDDPLMSTWSATDCAFVVSFIETLLGDDGLRFGVPARFGRAGSEQDDEWHAWVSGRLEELLQLRDLSFERLTAAGFIG